MRHSEKDDTIVAIATAVGASGIGIVRLSGPRSLRIADKVFVSRHGGKPSSFGTHTIHYGWIVHGPAADHRSAGREDTECIDEVLLSVMRAPRSYTREDVVEVSCHGGIAAVRRVLSEMLEHGARMAEPGEFTRRAFLNGRIDLTQAEAVADVIKAQTDYALRMSLRQLRGHLTALIDGLRQKLVAALTRIEVTIDFVAEDVPVCEKKELRSLLQALCADIERLLREGRRAAAVKDGVRVVLSGRANVGKSSLLNALLRYERSIVTHIPGTTRDTVEEAVDMCGIPVRLVDTAGILEARNLIDKKAMLRSRQSAEQADIVLLIFDGSAPLRQEDKRLIKRLKNRRVIAVVNKCDLKQRIETDVLRGALGDLVTVSAKKQAHLDRIEHAVREAVYSGQLLQPESALAINQRQCELLRRTSRFVKRAVSALNQEFSGEFIAEELKGGLACLDGLLGTKFTDDLLDRIFGEFCIGK